MAGLLSVFAQFEHDLLRERVRAGLAEAKLKGNRLGHPRTRDAHAGRIRILHRAALSKAEIQTDRIETMLRDIGRALGLAFPRA
ncbi:MAG: recombinase family protein [Bryobacteraceae bacterium]|nr:recombinase family protein [Bryobacteraceae bacterium]